MCRFEQREKIARQVITSSVETPTHRPGAGQCVFGEHPSNQPTTLGSARGSPAPEHIARAEGGSHKLCLEAGMTVGMDQSGTRSRKAVPDATASSSCTFTTGRICEAKGLQMQVTGTHGEQRQSCGTLHRTSAPPCQLPRPKQCRAHRQPRGPREDRPTLSEETATCLWPASSCQHLGTHQHTSAHICPVAGARRHAPRDAATGKGCCSLTFRIQRCLDRSANPCAFASLCHACRWSGGQHPLRYGRDIRHSWCLTLSPSGTFSP